MKDQVLPRQHPW